MVVELRLEATPVVAVGPVVSKFLDIRERGALLPVCRTIV
jgi:hypothetical protein